MENLKIDLGYTSYPITFDTNFGALSDYFGSVPDISEKKLMVVTDTNVAPLYLNEVKTELEKTGCTVYTHVFSAGEASKTLETISEIYKSCLEAGLDRSSYIVALGGGVCGDMAGFAAATYMRGISFVQVPTTLLAQVDSSVGGKVGVDFSGGKNLIGAFYQPKLVAVNLNTLKSLPERDFVSGMAEVIKYGIIYDKAFFELLDLEMAGVLALETEILGMIIRRCCEIKCLIVSQDERETGRRAILNYGHTIGHAIESSLNFKLYHGECVSVGMVAAANLAQLEGMCGADLVKDTVKILKKAGLPVSVRGVDAKTVLDLMQHDKKKEGNEIKFVLAQQIGKVNITKNVCSDNIRRATEMIIDN